ncbi:unnamed protein product, partial [Heligmosomoides polygyrus]|uniref:Neur_chan_LBD domain-containing protein n=1 Tax=Heligmosomoides polygyrus TaxID=6339 RepID=A0A183GND0_HELPZ
ANEDFDSTYKSNEVVYSTGEVNWVPPGIFRASCKMDITFFPFDDQVCHLKFGSWTYNGNALDLRIITADGEEPSMDLSTYTPSGEWNLISMLSSGNSGGILFKMLPRALLNCNFLYAPKVVFPSLLISLMTLVGFCLPAHDMSEKIGYQTTILLSICFFVTIVSEVTPPTSESVPLLGMFFSTLTLIVAVSTTFTITVLHCRYRQPYNSRMTKVFRSFFLEWLPRVLLMSNHPKNRQYPKASLLHDDYQLPCADVCNMSMLDSQDDMESFLTSTVSSLRKER